MKSNSSGNSKKFTSLTDAELEQWLAEALDAPSRKSSSLDPQRDAILSMVDRVRDTLVPIQPSASFVRDLENHLIESARYGQQSLLRRYRKVIIISAAAAGSLVSAVGVTALLLRQRNRRTV